ncbi:hypothetical protein, partial [Acinetobacter baumannii]|uniref:hypothetical protein n=1 Tax=Acinetobacter baumannii TaxID=470 RepID=UPI002241DC10
VLLQVEHSVVVLVQPMKRKKVSTKTTSNYIKRCKFNSSLHINWLYKISINYDSAITQTDQIPHKRRLCFD